jgi:hypothetical protein
MHKSIIAATATTVLCLINPCHPLAKNQSPPNPSQKVDCQFYLKNPGYLERGEELLQRTLRELRTYPDAMRVLNKDMNPSERRDGISTISTALENLSNSITRQATHLEEVRRDMQECGSR